MNICKVGIYGLKDRQAFKEWVHRHIYKHFDKYVMTYSDNEHIEIDDSYIGKIQFQYIDKFSNNVGQCFDTIIIVDNKLVELETRFKQHIDFRFETE